MTSKINNIYSTLTGFLEQIKIDKEMSLYLYIKTDDNKYYKEYLYNKNYLKTVKEILKNKLELRMAINCIHETRTLCAISKVYKHDMRTFYHRAKQQFYEFKEEIYQKEEVLYDKFIKGNVDENNKEAKSRGMERTL